MKEIICCIMIFAIVLTVGIYAWQIGKKINYKLSYKNLVKETVQEMVKPDALKEQFRSFSVE